jgi:guanylate kinase
VARDPTLWLSRSWTTRPRRPGEAEDAYVFVDEPTFRARIAEDGFFEWAEFLGHLYGTPIDTVPEGCDALFEIDVQGAEQVLAKRPRAVVILLVPPSTEVQAARLVARGDPADQVALRISSGLEEIRRARRLTSHEVVNDDVVRATTEVAGIVAAARSARLEHS